MNVLSSMLILACLLIGIIADVPNHCLKDYIVGKWEFQVRAPKKVESRHEVNCGHEEPDNPITSWKSLREIFEG